MLCTRSYKNRIKGSRVTNKEATIGGLKEEDKEGFIWTIKLQVGVEILLVVSLAKPSKLQAM